MKTISKVIVYYDDGTFQEVTPSVHTSQNKEDKSPPQTSPVIPDLRPDYYKIQEYTSPKFVPDPYTPPWTVTCDTNANVPLKYTISSDARDMASWNFTSTGNFSNDNKYSITSTGNGINVDLSK
jgi:hypothetical protein